jgi:hypothetical protein
MRCLTLVDGRIAMSKIGPIPVVCGTLASAGRCLLSALLLAWSIGANAQPTDNELAQRFRPYLKFSLRGALEDARPVSWQWLYTHSRFRRKDAVLAPAGSSVATMAQLALDNADVRRWGQNDSDNVHIEVDDAFIHGGPWTDDGTGVYAHVTSFAEPRDVSDRSRLVNIEYWILFPFNIGYITPQDHKGDIVGVQMVYDRTTDRLVRASYSQHGETMIAFDLARIEAPVAVSLAGRDIQGRPISVSAQRLTPLDHGYSADGLAPGFFTGGDPHVFAVADPQTGRFEHLAVYLEFGAHEPWPNSSGYYVGVANHDGNGVSYLPGQVHLLDAGDEAFVFYGGDFGDPKGLTRHRMWFGFDESHSPVDRNAYTRLGPLDWPPVVDPYPGCTWTPFTSEERQPAMCQSGVITAMRCEGRYCDNVSVQCCPAAQPDLARRNVTPWFSEESPSSRSCPAGQLAVGVACKGSYCDSIALTCAPVNRQLGACEWTGTSFSEEGNGLGQCAAGGAVSAAVCSGSYCDDKRLFCCHVNVPVIPKNIVVPHGVPASAAKTPLPH